MKTAAVTLALALVCLAAAPARANIVGYINVPIYSGNNLLANQLNGIPDNTLDSTILNAPDGTTFTMWDPVANAFLPLSTYSATTTNWSINYNFALGQGGVLDSPSASVWTATFVGQVDKNYPPVGSTPWQPNYGAGRYLISYPEPMSATFADVVGRAPRDGESVDILNPVTQVYTTTTYNAGTMTWDNGAPSLAVGESAWFNLVSVPEPSLAALASLGLAVLSLARRTARRDRRQS